MDEDTWKVELFPEVSKFLLLLQAAQRLLKRLSFPSEELEITKNSRTEQRGDKYFTQDGKQLDIESFGPTGIRITPLRASLGLLEALLKMYTGKVSCLIYAKANRQVTKKAVRERDLGLYAHFDAA